LEIAPEWSLGHYNYGTLLARTRRYPQAVEEFRAAQALDPAAAAALHRAALVLEWMGRPAEAVQQLEKALSIEPGRMEAMLDLAWLLSTHPDPRIRDGKRALELASRAG